MHFRCRFGFHDIAFRDRVWSCARCGLVTDSNWTPHRPLSPMPAPAPRAHHPKEARMGHEFKFELNQVVVIEASSESGKVISRAEHTTGEDNYCIRYKAADGRAVEQWWPVSALVAA